MTTRRLTFAWTFALTLACARAPSSETSSTSDSEDSGTSSTSETGDTETGDTETGDTDDTSQPVCNDAFCTAQCGLDECGDPFEGICHDDGTCSCVPTVHCIPCVECDTQYEWCAGDYTIDGECLIQCYYEFPSYTWEGTCTLALPDDLPHDVPLYIDIIHGSLFVTIDGMQMPRGENCDDPPAPFAWWIDAEVTTITLCSEMCAQFEQGGELVAGWGFPCE